MVKHAAYFTIHGRLNRKRFIKRSLFLGAVVFLLSFLTLALLGLSPADLVREEAQYELMLVLGPVGALCMLYGLSMSIQRWHDLNVSTMMILGTVLCMLDPYIQMLLGVGGGSMLQACGTLLDLAVYIPLFFFRGTAGANCYGEDLLAEPGMELQAAKPAKKPVWYTLVVLVMGLYAVSVVLTIVS